MNASKQKSFDALYRKHLHGTDPAPSMCSPGLGLCRNRYLTSLDDTKTADFSNGSATS